MFFVYILKSLKDGGFYYGSSSELEKRIKSHNTGKVRSTKSRRPFVLHYVEEFQTKKEAIQRELFFKSIDGYNWLKEKSII
jgi:putative endonuclease